MPLTCHCPPLHTPLHCPSSPHTQVWEETAAQHVSIKQELSAVAALATRWRRIELSGWKGLLQRVVAAHTAGAATNWYYLYSLLSGAEMEAWEEGAAEAGAVVGEVDAYQRTASLLEAFMQTSTQVRWGRARGSRPCA